jgi:hypothetical protein
MSASSRTPAGMSPAGMSGQPRVPRRRSPRSGRLRRRPLALPTPPGGPCSWGRRGGPDAISCRGYGAPDGTAIARFRRGRGGGIVLRGLRRLRLLGLRRPLRRLVTHDRPPAGAPWGKRPSDSVAWAAGDPPGDRPGAPVRSREVELHWAAPHGRCPERRATPIVTLSSAPGVVCVAVAALAVDGARDRLDHHGLDRPPGRSRHGSPEGRSCVLNRADRMILSVLC